MAHSLQALGELATALGRLDNLDAALQLVADRTAELLAAPRVSVRMLDPSRSRLLATARAGQPLHAVPVEFRPGEGLIGWIVAQRAPLRTGDAERDPRFLPRPGMVERMGSFLGVPIVVGGACTGVISVVHPDADRFTADDEQLLTLVASLCAPHLEVIRLQRLAHVDPLTGTLNRRGLDAMFPEVEARVAPVDGVIRPLAIGMADIDHFKQINDTHGHPAGDEVLARVAALLSSVLRAGDAVVRFGGEEFLLILPGVDLARAVRIAERARTAVEATAIPAGAASIRCTVSIGVAERRDGEPRDTLVERADQALYAAKHGGRNVVRAAG